MTDVSLTRHDLSIPWGFRLKGGAEYNVPLSILKVNEKSPASAKLDVGDTILRIGTINASNLKHEEALNIFRMFDYNLPLTIVKERNPMVNQNRPTPLVWSPSASVSTAPESVYSPSHQYRPQPPMGAPESNIYSPSHQFKPQQPLQANTYRPTISSFPSQDMTAPISIDYASYQNNYKPQGFNSPVQQNFNNNLLMKTPGSPSYSGHEQYNAGNRPMSPLSMSPLPKTHYEPPPAPPLPPPPMPGSGLSPLFNFKKGPETPTASSFPSSSPGGGHHRAPSESSSGEIPSALLKAMNYSPMGKKPFTYTPGGLDLSHVRNSARVKRHDSARTHEDDRNRAFVTNSYEKPAAPINTGYMTPNFAGGYQNTPPTMHRPHESPMYVSQTNLASQGNYRDSAAPSPSFGGNHSVGADAPRVYGTLPRNFREKQPSVSSFNPEEIKMTPKRNSESRDMVNQSFSFRMLNKWIANSESTQPPAQQAEEPKKVSEVKKALEDDQHMAKPVEYNPPVYNRVAPAYSDYAQPQPPQHQPAYLNRVAPQSPAPPMSFSQPANFNKVTPINYVRPVKPAHHQTVMDRKHSIDYSEAAFGANNSSSNSYSIKPIYPVMPGVPARERDQESDVPRYKGNQIPSKTFRYLQYLTETESVIQQSPKKSANPSEPANSSTVAPQAMSTSTNQATFLNDTSSSFANSSNDNTRVQVLSSNEQHQHHQQQQFINTQQTPLSTETSVSINASSAESLNSQQQKHQEQQLSASLSHGLVLHESDDLSASKNALILNENAASSMNDATNSSSANTTSSSSAIVFASDEPISTFVDLQSSESVPDAGTNISIEIVQQNEGAEETAAKPAANSSGDQNINKIDADDTAANTSTQAVHIDIETTTNTSSSAGGEAATTTTAEAVAAAAADASVPIEISDF